MNKLLLFLFLLPFTSFAQRLPDTINPNRSWFALSAGSQLRNRIFSGVDFQLSVPVSAKWRFEAQSFTSFSHRFDLSNQWNKEHKPVRSLLYNQSALTFVRELISTRRNTKSGFREINFGFRSGYFYSQQAMYNMVTADAYLFRIASNGDKLFISGIKTHALTAGLDLSVTKSSKKRTFNQRIYADFVAAVNLKYTGYQLTSNLEYSKAKIDDDFSRNHYGARFGYDLRWYRSGKVGFIMAMEVNLRPAINFTFHESYVPRGGEGLSRFSAGFKTGITYRL